MSDKDKTIAQIDEEVDKLLTEIEQEQVYKKIHKPKVDNAVSEFVRSIPQNTRVMARKRYIKQHNEDVKRQVLETGDYTNAKYLSADEDNLEELKKYPVEKYLDSMGIKLNHIGYERLNCCCPLHNEKVPSFVIYVATNSWYCFGCGRGGSIIDLIMYIEHCNIGNAIKILKEL